ncbi:MAG: rhodanese-like domain-containing protein [Candidatus Hydrogenedentota bacterium]
MARFRLTRTALLGAGMLVILAVAGPWAMFGEVQHYSVEEVNAKREADEDLVLVDVRTEPEYAGALGTIAGAELIPLDELEDRLDELEAHRGREIVLVCRTQNRSRAAAALLRPHGFRNLAVMDGGMKAWRAMKEQK